MNPEVLGTFATMTSLAYMAFGLPVQSWKIYKAKSTKGVSLLTQCTLFLTTLSWCIYSAVIGNKYIIMANAPGAFFALIILFQFWMYRNREVITSPVTPFIPCCILVDAIGWGGDMHERLALLDLRQIQSYIPELIEGKEIWYTHQGGTSRGTIVTLINESTLASFKNYRKHTVIVEEVKYD